MQTEERRGVKKNMIAYRIDGGGQCQTVSFPSHQHFLQMVLTQDIHHVLYYPPLSAVHSVPNVDKSVAVYASPHHGVVFILPQCGDCLNTQEISLLYQWALTMRLRLAYPFLRKDILPAEADNYNPLDIQRWCDTQIDAFTFFRIGQLALQRTRKRRRAGGGDIRNEPRLAQPSAPPISSG